MKIAVTGANGFIGQYVLAELETYPIEVIPIVRNPTRSGLTDSMQSKAVGLDIECLPQNIFEYIGYPDVLIHLAWGGLPNYRSLHHFERELPIQYNFLQSLVKSGLPSLVVAGTCFEYGMKSGGLRENIPTVPTNPYGFAKDTLYRQLKYLQEANPFSLTWARLFYLYGEGQAERSLLPQLRNAVRRGDKIFNMSGGEQLRDYLPVTDIAKYLVLLAMLDKDIGAINVCSGEPISVRRLVEQWINDNNWDIDINLGYYSYPDYEPMAFWGDRQKLNFYMGNQ